MSNSLEFLLDENVRVEVIDFLKEKGFSAEYVPTGLTNHEVASLAKAKQSVFVTHDTDFANPFLYPPKEFFGIVVLRISPYALERILSSLEKLLREVKKFSGKLVILETEGLRLIESQA